MLPGFDFMILTKSNVTLRIFSYFTYGKHLVYPCVDMLNQTMVHIISLLLEPGQATHCKYFKIILLCLFLTLQTKGLNQNT